MREMKDSGVVFSGIIPADWEVRATKYLFHIFSGATPKSDHPEYYDGDIIWITPADYKSSDVFVSAGRRNISLEGLNSCSAVLVPEGSIIFSKRAPIGAVAICSKELCTNQGCLACVPKTDNITKFFYYLMCVSTENYNILGTGTTFKEISAFNFSNFQLPFPCVEKQIKIVNILDIASKKIGKLVDNESEQIEKLKQYKQSLISEAVTRGLDPSVPMKDSGVEWIGAIPFSWGTIRIKHLLLERKERSVLGDEEPLSMSQKYGLIPTKEMDMVPNMASSFVGAKIAYPNDLVFNKMKAHLGVFSLSKYHGLVSPDYAVYSSTGRANLKYLEYLFKTPQCISEFRKKSTGIAAGLTRLYTDDLFSIECPFPPISVQDEIVAFLNKKTYLIDKLINAKQSKISKLTQYKSSLIYEYVTGKKEVV